MSSTERYPSLAARLRQWRFDATRKVMHRFGWHHFAKFTSNGITWIFCDWMHCPEGEWYAIPEEDTFERLERDPRYRWHP